MTEKELVEHAEVVREMIKTPTSSVDSWEEDFDYHVQQMGTHPDVLKLFIRSLLASTEDSRNPMGVSQWREHGKRYGYWDFFERRVREETEAATYARAVGDALEAIGKNEPEPINDDFNDGGDDEYRERRLAVDGQRYSAYLRAKREILESVQSLSPQSHE